MEKYIILALILLFGVIYYFDDGKKELTVSDLEKISNQQLNEDRSPKRSWIKSITNAIKHKNRPDDGIRRVGSNKPDSDTSACVGWPKSDKDMIVTKFAGYTLQYPCTVNQKGEYHIEYNSDGSILSQRFRLYISLVLGQEKGSIWWNGSHDSLKDTQSFRLAFWNDGKLKSDKPIEDWIKSAKQIKVIDKANLIVFRKGIEVKAFIKDLFESNKSYVYVGCSTNKNTDSKELFNPLFTKGIMSSCHASWILTPDISLAILKIQTKYVYHFNEIYQEINNKLPQIFIKYSKTKTQEK